MSQTLRNQAEDRYREVRREARESVIESLRELSSPDVSLSEITEDALAQADKWRSHYPVARHSFIPGWSWRKVVSKFRRRPKRIELALWQNTTLCGLAVGRISDGCIVATIHYVESLPLDNPLQGKVVPFIVRYLEAVATHLGCQTVTIEKPVPELLAYYKGLGFTFAVIKGNQVIRLRKQLESIQVDVARPE